MTADVYSMYKNDEQIPIKASSLTFSSYMEVQKSVQVIVGGQIDSISSEDIEKSKCKIECEVPFRYEGVLIADLVRRVMRNKKAPLILKNESDGTIIAYKSVSLTENGETSDNGERFMKLTFEGTEITS